MILAPVQFHSKRHVSVPFERINTDSCSVKAILAKVVHGIVIPVSVPRKYLEKVFARVGCLFAYSWPP